MTLQDVMIKESSNIAKFGAQKHCASVGIMILICRMISQDHVIKSLLDFIGIKIIYYPTKFGDHSYTGSGDIMVLACHVISQDHVIKVWCDFIVASPSRYVNILPSLVVIGTVIVEI